MLWAYFTLRSPLLAHLASFRLFGKAVSEEKIFKKSTNQKQELSVAAMFVNGSGRNEQSLQRTLQRCFHRSYGSFGQTVSEEKNLKNQPIRNKNRLWWPCLLTDWDEWSNLYRGLSIDASYQVFVHLAKWFQRRRFLKIGQSLRNKNYL
jgi:predicted GIY-YIG superfamily endonuclease